ncbi:prolyl oligopeptidase family serine peptidase [Psychroflexus sp. YR1-1]|uniref:Prolyl oligopeptidase family serine peptidase n=1 Tax=Psychroflexus aurantiacus TaxID=2709310 RepID=A0A6B3QXX9_9FLAO|nr:prolyl oligopeptidase family serine peptidase [Psychroflexus aurantiacus]NEV93006.1 prolyl oligopeptidase family serine peptidase [Psychroflexus aurantiacus]
MTLSLRILSVALLASLSGFAQSDLSVQKIMQDPNWMGTFPSDVAWNEQSDVIYFNYNPEQEVSDSLYKINLKNTSEIQKVSLDEIKTRVSSSGDYNAKRTAKLFVKSGDLYRYDIRKNQTRLVLDLGERISSPKFITDSEYAFIANNNLYVYNVDLGQIQKKTNIQSGSSRDKDSKKSEKNQWLEEENLSLLEEVRVQKENRELREKNIALLEEDEYTFYLDKQRAFNFSISETGEFLTFQTYTPESGDNTGVPDYIDASGYTEMLNARSKVGDQTTQRDLYLYHIQKDTVFKVDVSSLPGITDLPGYTENYPDREWEEKQRAVSFSDVKFSSQDAHAVVAIRAQDNKDRWISLLNLDTGSLKNLDRQHDEAWIAGPGIGSYYGGGTLGWLADDTHIYYQSEATGYSHLYLHDVDKNKQKQLTSGNYEVFDPQLSRDKTSWFFTSSEVHPGERHFYKMPVMGGKAVQLTSMEGNNKVELSPDEKHMAILFSSSNTPEELYLKPTKASAKPKQLTEGQSEAFSAYTWRTPELIQFEAEDGAKPYARLYRPEENVNNHAAVIFVHGAGYLQNAHKWWSSYFREYMFHNLLTDLGYTVLDIDYRGSAGYGRDWRTGIYRHMGGKDLSDQVDGAEYLVENFDINPDKIGIYGGSYGGFITLMAMFNEPDTFAAGAALRSVTDWAHYNHGYTSNILNEPNLDPIAYRQSSPIYFAEGLEGHLLIAHGIVDTNVHFQDVVRLSQRLIELEKEDWELAVYPVEGHGFTQPSSWTDEYRRILELFERTIGK